MGLRPKALDFPVVWNEVLPTVRGIVSCGRVERSMWSNSFTYPLFQRHLYHTLFIKYDVIESNTNIKRVMLV